MDIIVNQPLSFFNWFLKYYKSITWLLEGKAKI